MSAALPTPSWTTAPERFALPEPATSCDQHEQPGVALFREFVLSHLGGSDLGILRQCSVGKPSEHHEGRSWDWGLDASRPEDATRAQELIDWLLAPDAQGEPAAMFRRLGLLYLIWDQRIWSARNQAWQSYGGASPHRDHVHFSFSGAGARGETSGYALLRGEQPARPPSPPSLPPSKTSPAVPWWPQALAFAVGSAVGWGLMRELRRTRPSRSMAR